MSPRRIVAVSAGLSQPSSGPRPAARLAEAASDALLQEGLESSTEVIELREHAHALANTLLTGFATGDLRKALDSIASADAVIAVTPVFQASYSGLFKTFFDVLEMDTLNGKPVLLAATGGTARHSLVLDYAMRPLFAHLKAAIAPTAVFAASEDWGSAGSAGQGLAERIQRAGAELAGLAAGRNSDGAADPFADPVPFEQLLSS